MEIGFPLREIVAKSVPGEVSAMSHHRTSKRLKVLYGPVNTSGGSYMLARAIRELGHEALSYDTSPSVFKFKSDVSVNLFTLSGKLKAIYFMFRYGLRYDVFHFFFGESLLSSYLYDVPYLKMLGKKVFFYFCGCDVRDSKTVIDKYKHSACKYCWPMCCSANRERAFEVAKKYADGIFVSTPDLLEFFDHAVLLPQPVDLEYLDEVSHSAVGVIEGEDEVVIAHAPSHKALKGTSFIEEAVKELKREGQNIRLTMVEKMPHTEALRVIAGADIIIDQLLIGWYGVQAVEAMYLEKPVVCYIRDGLEEYFSDECPIINANIENIKDIIRDLINKRDTWEELGRQGRSYVKKYHDSKVVAAKALEVYKSA